jgi:hypothetical protein
MRRHTALTLGLALPLIALPLRVQSQAGVIVARVLDARTSQPVRDALAWWVEGREMARSDSSGAVLFTKIKGGTHHIDVRAVGYDRKTFEVTVPNNERTTVDFVVNPTSQTLSTVDVRAAPVSKRYQEFELRRTYGRGHYFTRDDIEKHQFLTLMDAMRLIPGVRTECSGFHCKIRMARAPMGCDQPEVYIDGREQRSFGMTIPLKDVYGIEVYRGQSGVPAEFLGPRAACGTVVIWTRSAP